jgi:hypothetical protein
MSRTRKRLFKEIDDLLRSNPRPRIILTLADTGMGKTEFLKRYYAHCWRSKKRIQRFKPVILRLNSDSADSLIARINPDVQSRTLLLLDALDEDRAAIEDFPKRFAQLARVADSFYAVIITCRTQFLSGFASVQGEADQEVRRLYMSPFSDRQVSEYIAMRFRLWRHPILRIRSEIVTRRFRDVLCRPLLLTYIRDIASSSKEMKYTFQAYRVIVKKWLNRERKEKHTATLPDNLLCFCEDFAINLFTEGLDRIPLGQLQALADHCSVELIPREVRERSLLHNDTEGNWKFAHRSIMEFLLVIVASKGGNRTPWTDRRWTPQMRVFAREMLISGEYKKFPGADLEGEDLTGADLRDVDLCGANLCETLLEGVPLSGAILKDANLSRANLANTNMDFANVSGACFDGTVIHGLNLTKVRGLTLRQAASANSNWLTIWPVRTFQGYARDIYYLAISGDGRRVVSVSSGGTLKVWDICGGRQAPPLSLLHGGFVNAVALNSDGHFAVSASSDRLLKVWDLEKGCELPPSMVGHTDAVRCVALSSDGNKGVSVSSDHTLRVWNLSERCESIPLLECNSEGAAAISLSSDEKLLMAVSFDETLDIWSLEERRRIKSKKIEFGIVRHLALCANVGLLVSASADGTLGVWETESGQGRLELKGHSSAVSGIALSEGGHLAVYDSGSKAMRVWFPPDVPESSDVDLSVLNRMRKAVSRRRRGGRFLASRTDI